MNRYKESLEKYHTTKPKHLTIPSSYLISAQEYQRLVKTRHVQDIANKFNPLKFDEPVINFRDGTYYIVDGQHRVAALVFMNEGQPLDIRCSVYYGLTYKEEAQYYANQDEGHMKQTSYGKIYALKEAGDSNASGFIHTNRCLNLSIAFEDKFRGARRVNAPLALYGLFKQYGAHSYYRIMSMILHTWDDDEQLSANLIKAVFQFDKIYGNKYKEKTFVTKMQRINPAAVLVSVAESMGGSTKDNIVTLMVSHYNAKLKNENKI